MNARERFRATMHYQPVDRCPIMDFGFWSETLVIWEDYGFPKGANPDVWFGMDPQWAGAPVNTFLCPGFEYTVLEDKGDTIVVRDGDGVTKEQGKFLGSIPRHLDHTLKDRASWEKEVKWRLDGTDSRRYPANWDEYVALYNDPNRDYPLCISGGSLYGKLRELMSVENISMLVYDDRPLFDEMIETVANCIIDSVTPALEAGIQFEYVSMWEDMCYRAGPLLSPKVFAETLVPQYKRITDHFLKYGVDVFVLDCDGDISKLVPHWLEGGVNCMFPIEVGVWGADPVAYRKQYGKGLLMIGGVSKRMLAGTREEITREVNRLAPLVEEGGFIPTPDHRVPADVPLDNYLFYLREARRVWGRNAPDLRPMGELNPNAPKKLTDPHVWTV